MSDRISKCCGWGVHLGGIEFPAAFNICDQCMKPCDVETVEQRDHRMRVEGAVAALEHHLRGSVSREWAERIVREMEERDKR